MPGFYPDKPPEASDGTAFEHLGRRLHWTFLRERIEVFADRHRQYTIGESPQRIEFKELKRSFERFHIEIEERTGVTRQWWPSGIMRDDNAVRYCCGNNEDVFVFLKSALRQWREINQPPEVWYGRDCGLTDVLHPMATIRSFVLPKVEALLFCLYRFQHIEGRMWEITVRDREWMSAHIRVALGAMADTPLGLAAINRITR